MAVAQPSYTNVFVPAFTTKLIVDFSRNPKDFLVNLLTTNTPTTKPIDYYMRVKPDSQARIDGLNSYLFADGAARPIQTNNMHEFEFVKFFTQRYTYTAALGNLTADNAVYDIRQKIAHDLANKAMLQRAVQFYRTLSTAGNYLSGHIDTATNWGGGKWDVSTGTGRFIQRGLMAAARQILKSTVNGNVGLSDLFLVVGPDVADKMARSAEIADYIRESQPASDYIQFSAWADQNKLYGLPQVLYGIKVVVDETIKDETKLGQTSDKQFLPGATTAYLITKQGGTKSVIGTGNFSSVHFFTHTENEMKVETFDEPVNLRSILSVTDAWDCQMVSKETTIAFTAVVD